MDFNSVPLVLKVMLVGGHPEHPFQPVVAELDHAPAAAANQVGMLARCFGRLVPLESFAKIVFPDQPALHQRLDCSVERGQTDRLAPFDQPAAEDFDRRMVPAGEQHVGHPHPLPGDREPAVPEKAPEPIDQEQPVSRGWQGTTAPPGSPWAAPRLPNASAPTPAARPAPRWARCRPRRFPIRTGPGSFP